MRLRMKNWNIFVAHWKIEFLWGRGFTKKPIYSGELTKKGGWTFCRFKGTLARKRGVICIYILYIYVLQLLSSKVVNAVNSTLYIYFGFLTKTTIIGHYTVFHGLIPIFRWLQFIQLSLSQWLFTSLTY